MIIDNQLEETYSSTLQPNQTRSYTYSTELSPGNHTLALRDQTASIFVREIEQKSQNKSEEQDKEQNEQLRPETNRDYTTFYSMIVIIIVLIVLLGLFYQTKVFNDLFKENKTE